MAKEARKQLINPKTPEQSAALLDLAKTIRADLDDIDADAENLTSHAFRAKKDKIAKPLPHMHPDLPYLVVLLGLDTVRTQVEGRTEQIRVQGLDRIEETPQIIVDGYLGALLLIAAGTQRPTSGFINEEFVIASPDDTRTEVIDNYGSVT